MKRSFLMLLICIIGVSALAQDRIYKKDKTVIDCKVLEIGVDVIKYHPADELDGPLIAISIDNVVKIVLANGRTIEFNDPLNDPATYATDRKHAIKLHFLSPLNENLTFSYERNSRPGRSIETTFGVIGLGINTQPDDRSTGFHTGFGIKFMRTPDFYSSRYRYSHLMKGSYVKPQILFSAYRNEYSDYFYPTIGTKEQDVLALGLLINLGKQIVFDNFFLIDYSIGLGYGFTNLERLAPEVSNFRANHYGFLVGDKEFPVAVSFNLKVGFLLN